ncbi:MAG: L-ribulose-5-phosphate 4-epimerase AraD [Solirubrobacteraceae bacterium]
MLDDLCEAVLAANLALPEYGLVKLTWGNVSGLDRERGVLAIKPSGVAYSSLTAADIVLVDMDSGDVVAGERRPSSDTPTHAALYRAWPSIGGIVHTHSTFATAWAQAGREIPVLGTTHADFSGEPIPVTRALTPEEIAGGYEAATGTVVIEAVRGRADRIPAALVTGHAPFCWGTDAAHAVETAVTLEEVARLALLSTLLEPAVSPLDERLRDKHFDRKHGPGAYYGQG